jgi:hypothetical protein
MRNSSPVNNINDKEIVERTFIFGSLMSIITSKNLKGYNLLGSFVKDKKVLELYKETIEINDDRKAVLEYIKIVDIKKKV